MNVALRRGMTLGEFLEWDEGQEDRWEFDGFAPVAMTGGTREHAVISVNVLTSLNTRLRGTRCSVYNDNLQIRPRGSVRYPDAFVSCTPVERGGKRSDHPVVVFEVLSPSTASSDQMVKNAEYRATPSIQQLRDAVAGPGGCGSV